MNITRMHAHAHRMYKKMFFLEKKWRGEKRPSSIKKISTINCIFFISVKGQLFSHKKNCAG